jgi:hypothetical protein
MRFVNRPPARAAVLRISPPIASADPSAFKRTALAAVGIRRFGWSALRRSVLFEHWKTGRCGQPTRSSHTKCTTALSRRGTDPAWLRRLFRSRDSSQCGSPGSPKPFKHGRSTPSRGNQPKQVEQLKESNPLRSIHQSVIIDGIKWDNKLGIRRQKQLYIQTLSRFITEICTTTETIECASNVGNPNIVMNWIVKLP